MFPLPMAGLHHAAEKNEGDGDGTHDDDVKHWKSEESGIGRTEDFESIFGVTRNVEAGRHARAVMWSVHRRLQRDDAMLLGYRTFARFLGYVVLFILVVYFQVQSLRSENRVQYGAVRSAVFGLDVNVTTDGSVDVSSHLASYAVLSDWVEESVIPSVWTLPSCGDAECTEELPGFDAGEGTRATFCVEINHWFGGSPPNFRTLYLNQIAVDSADFWTDRLLSSSSRSTAESLASKRSHTRTLKSG